MGFGESLDAVVALIQTSVYREDCVFGEAMARVERIVDGARIKGKRGGVGRGGPRAKPPSRLDLTCNVYMSRGAPTPLPQCALLLRAARAMP